MNTAKSTRQPLSLHVHTGNKSKLGEEEQEARADAEITMGEMKFCPPAAVTKNVEAMKKWREITKIYRDSGLVLVSSTDNGVLARYCMLYAEYWELVEQRSIISDLKFPSIDEDELFAEIGAEYRHARARRLWNIMEYFTKLDGVMKLDKAINAKVKSILDVEDRIFLNPAAKVRTLPIKRRPKEKDELGDLGFDV